MPNVRIKATCTEKLITAEGETVKFLPVVSGSEENKNFFKWTPSGSIQLGIANREASASLVVGAQYYVDFTPAE